MDTKPAGRSILRRSSIILQRRLSRDNSVSSDDFQHQQAIWSANVAAAVQRRSSVQQISTDSTPPRRASISFGRRSSIATVKKSKETFFVGSLPKLSDISVSSEWDISSNCSEISELLEDVDYTDPCDWFLDEEMEDEPMFEILPKEELIQRMRDSVDSVASQLNVSPGNAVLVLQQFEWDLENLLHDYFDLPEYYLKKAGVVEKSSTTSTCTSGNNDSSIIEKCKVCLDEKLCQEFFALGCGHLYCRDCWQEYLQGLAITEGSLITQSSCMAPQCNAKLTEQDFEAVALPSTLQRYLYFLLKEYSEKELHAVICPNPACGNAVVYSGAGRPTDVVECHCGTRFCYSCGHEKHNPVSCGKLMEWLTLLQDDSESLDFIKATSKPCFHCGTFTERISGCNHMICRRGTGGCGGEWCWMCRRDWTSHGAHTGGFYSCNKYEESEAKVIDDESQKFLSHKNESRFLHYYNRYFNHDVLMKDVMKELNSGDVQITMGEYSKLTNADPEFFLEAAELLVECRRVLKYTYVYGYFMDDSPSKALFEYQQASAEGITERLSELFHTPVDVIAKSPLEFVNYVRVTKKFISNLVKSIEEGFTSDISE